ncbi:hypothetical protein ACLOJK_034611 [Asimina triloba]
MVVGCWDLHVDLPGSEGDATDHDASHCHHRIRKMQEMRSDAGFADVAMVGFRLLAPLKKKGQRDRRHCHWSNGADIIGINRGL